MNDKQEEEQMRERETETENSWKYKLQWVLTFLIISLSRLEAKKITPEVTRVAEWTYTYTSICTHSHTHNPIHLPPPAPPARSSDFFSIRMTSSTSPFSPLFLLKFYSPSFMLSLSLHEMYVRSSLWPLPFLLTYVLMSNLCARLTPAAPIHRERQQCSVACSHWCLSVSCLLNRAHTQCLILNPIVRDKRVAPLIR